MTSKLRVNTKVSYSYGAEHAGPNVYKIVAKTQWFTERSTYTISNGVTRLQGVRAKDLRPINSL